MTKIAVKDDTNPAKFDSLSEFINAIARGDTAKAESNVQAYMNVKAKEVVQSIREDASKKEEDDKDDVDPSKFLKNRDKKKPALKKMKKMDEAFLTEFQGEDSPIKLKGDDVFVEGKLVGSIQNDLNDDESGITFKSSDGKIGEEFDTVPELYSFLMDHYAPKVDLE